MENEPTDAEIAQLEHHILDHEVTCSYSCSLIRKCIAFAKKQKEGVS